MGYDSDSEVVSVTAAAFGPHKGGLCTSDSKDDRKQSSYAY